MHTPLVDTFKYLFLCFVSLEVMHLLMRSSLNFTYIPIIALVLTILYAIDIRRPSKSGAPDLNPTEGTYVKVEKKRKIRAEKKAL